MARCVLLVTHAQLWHEGRSKLPIKVAQSKMKEINQHISRQLGNGYSHGLYSNSLFKFGVSSTRLSSLDCNVIRTRARTWHRQSVGNVCKTNQATASSIKRQDIIKSSTLPRFCMPPGLGSCHNARQGTISQRTTYFFHN